MTAYDYVAWRLRVIEFLEHAVYSHAPRNDFSVNDGSHIRRWSHNIIILQYLPLCYNCIQYSVQ
jgi:hypothetical protein